MGAKVHDPLWVFPFPDRERGRGMGRGCYNTMKINSEFLMFGYSFSGYDCFPGA
jgi:hypothetical protein